MSCLCSDARAPPAPIPINTSAGKEARLGRAGPSRPWRQGRKHRKNVHFCSLQGQAPDPNAACGRKIGGKTAEGSVKRREIGRASCRERV